MTGEEIKEGLKYLSDEMRADLRTLSLYTSEQYSGGKKTVTKKMVDDIYKKITTEEEADIFDCGLTIINLMVRRRDAFFMIESNLKKAADNIRLNLERLKLYKEHLDTINALAEIAPEKAKSIIKGLNKKDNEINFKQDQETGLYTLTAIKLSSVIAKHQSRYKAAIKNAKSMAIFFEQYLEEFKVRDLALKEILEVIEEYKKNYSVEKEYFDLYCKYCIFGDARAKATSPDYCFMPNFEQAEQNLKVTYKQFYQIL